MKVTPEIEAVARAIYKNRPGPDGTEIFSDEPWRSCIDAAIAALEALMEPTERMLKARNRVDNDEYLGVTEKCARELFAGMLRAALGRTE